MKGRIKIGPVGKHDPGSKTMVNWDEGDHNGIISQIFISHDSNGIFSIQFQFLIDGKLVLSDRHGQNTGNMFDVITLNCQHEYVTGISGTVCTYKPSNPAHIMSLKFITNMHEYGPFGSSRSKNFEFNLGRSCRQFGGVYGTYDASGLQSIGVYLQPTTTNPGLSNYEEIESTEY